LLAVVEELDADAGAPAQLMGGQAAAGLAGELGIGLGRCNRLEVLGNRCSHGLLLSLLLGVFYHVVETHAILETLERGCLDLPACFFPATAAVQRRLAGSLWGSARSRDDGINPRDELAFRQRADLRGHRPARFEDHERRDAADAILHLRFGVDVAL